MAINEAYVSTGSVIGTTEYSLPNDSTTLTPITVDGVYQIWIELANMVAGDEYQLTVKEKVHSAGTQRTVYNVTLVGGQPGPWVSPSLILLHGWDVTLKKISGTDRSFAWSIRKVA